MSRKLKFFSIVLILIVIGYFLFQNAQSQIYVVSNAPDSAKLTEEKNSRGGLPFKLPQNFSLSIFAKDLPGARVLLFDISGRLLVSLIDQGKIVVLSDQNKDGKAETAKILLNNLDHPHGMAMKCNSLGKSCALFVAEENRVDVYGYDIDRQAVANKKKLSDLPSGGRHITRSLLIAKIAGKDRLLVSVGSSCNVCNEKDSRRAAILSMDLDGKNQKIFSQGLRNTVFITSRPETTEIWGTDMGRDLLGDKLPPDEINVLQEGKNYGWPICYGKNIHDENFDKRRYFKNPCTEPTYRASKIDLPAHMAPLGLSFFPKEGWPVELQGDLLVALHGSWNSSVPVGYKIIKIDLDAIGNPKKIEDFMTGFLTSKQQKIGRPVALVARPDGTIYISDDSAGLVYRLRYDNPQK